MARDPGGRRNAHTLDAQARDLVAFPTSAAKAAVRCPRVRADRSPADRAAVPPASAPLRRKRAVAHDVEAQFSTVVTPALGAGHPVDRVHRSSVPGGNPRFSPKISEVKATDQQRPAQAPRRAPRGRPPRLATVSRRDRTDVRAGLADGSQWWWVTCEEPRTHLQGYQTQAAGDRLLDRAPEPCDDDVVPPRSLTVHTQRRAVKTPRHD